MALEDRDEKQAAPYPNDRDCVHGSLRRSCERCEDAARIAALEGQLREREADFKRSEKLRGEYAEALSQAASSPLLARAESAEAALAAAREDKMEVQYALAHSQEALREKCSCKFDRQGNRVSSCAAHAQIEKDIRDDRDKRVIDLEVQIAAAVALNKKLIHAQELDLAEKAELRKALAAARAENEILRNSLREQLDAVTAAMLDRTDERDTARSALAAARERIKLFENLLTTMPSYGELVDAAGLAIVTQDELERLRARTDDAGRVERDDTNRLDWLLSFASVEDVGDEHVVPGVMFRIEDAESQLLGPSLEWTPRHFIDSVLARIALAAADGREP